MQESDSPVFTSQGKVISVLLPSRGRPDALRDALRNLAETCKDPAQVEILIRLDDDDSETLNVEDSLATECAPIDLSVITGPRGEGYRDLNVFLNELVAVARGDFLFHYNDDARIDTKGWDQLVAMERERLSILQPRILIVGEHAGTFKCHGHFPIVHRKIVDLLGYFAPKMSHSFCDTWVQDIGRWCGIEVDMLSMRMRHFQGKVKDKTFTETTAAYDLSPLFYAPEAVSARRADADRISRHLARCGRRLDIQDGV